MYALIKTHSLMSAYLRFSQNFHAWIQKVSREMVQLWRFFYLVDERREDPNTTICMPTSACQQNTIQMAFCWGADDEPTLNAGGVALCFFRVSGPVLLWNPIFLWFFRRGPDPLFPLWINPWLSNLLHVELSKFIKYKFGLSECKSA